MEIEKSLVSPGEVQISHKADRKWRAAGFLLDTSAKVNVISQIFIIANNLCAIDAPQPPIIKGINRGSSYCHGTNLIAYCLKDSWGHQKEATGTFYALVTVAGCLIVREREWVECG